MIDRITTVKLIFGNISPIIRYMIWPAFLAAAAYVAAVSFFLYIGIGK